MIRLSRAKVKPRTEGQTMTTKKHAEALGTRRAKYADRKVSNKIDRIAADLMKADSSLNHGEARRQALQIAIRTLS
jgi:hypothetical protein